MASHLLVHVAFAEEPSSSIKSEQLQQAAHRSQTENKHLLVAFLGEGWSVSCRKFSEKVLDTAEFKQFVEKNLVYLPVKARRKPKLSADETAVLQSWVIHFDIKSYPTLILLAPDGQEILRHGYRDIDAQGYVDLIQAILPPDN